MVNATIVRGSGPGFKDERNDVTKAKRTSLTALATLKTEGTLELRRLNAANLTPFRPSALNRLLKLASALPTVTTEGSDEFSFALQDDAQASSARDLVAGLSAWSKDLKTDPTYARLKARSDEMVKTLRAYVAAHEKPRQAVEKALRNAIVAFTEAQADEKARFAREEAKEEARQQAAENEREAKKLDRAAKKSKSRGDRVDFKAEAQALRDQALPDADAAAERARKEALGGEKGKGTVAENYLVLVDDPGLLVAAIVASNPELMEIAKGLAKQKLAEIPIAALNLKRETKNSATRSKGDLVPAPWLTALAAAHDGEIRIPGVICKRDPRYRSI